MSAIIIIHEPFRHVVKAVNSINNDQDLNLTRHRPRRPQGVQDEMAVWSVDDLFIKATATGEQLCELEAINFWQNSKGTSGDARKAWDELVNALRKKLPDRVEDCSDSERLARKTLVQIPPFEDKDHEEWQEEKDSAAHLSKEEAVQKMFDEEKALHGAAGDGGKGREQKTRSSDRKRDSCHYAHPMKKRRKIVQKYREAKEAGKVANKDAWAQTHYQITGRTLLNYEREFPEQ